MKKQWSFLSIALAMILTIFLSVHFYSCGSGNRNEEDLSNVNEDSEQQPTTLATGTIGTSAPCDHCITNEWMFIPGGTFEMGDAWGDGDNNEQPVHSVTLSDFYLQKYEVSFAEYNECVAAGVCDESMFSDDSHYNGDNQPVNGVDWQDAMDYCDWIGGTLPTEAQWEYAASWGTGDAHGKFKWALDKDNFNENNYCFDRWSDSEADRKYTCEIGNYPANALGLYDMSGNVWEWCLDRYQNDWYSQPASRNNNPLYINDTSGLRVYRGGGWSSSDSGLLRLAIRDGDNPALRYYLLGFRCASFLQD